MGCCKFSISIEIFLFITQFWIIVQVVPTLLTFQIQDDWNILPLSRRQYRTLYSNIMTAITECAEFQTYAVNDPMPDAAGADRCLLPVRSSGGGRA